MLETSNDIDKRNIEISKTVTQDSLKLTYTLYSSYKEKSGRLSFDLEVVSDYSELSDYCTAFDVTSESSRAIELFDTVCNNLVTPCTLCDILEDIL